MLAAISTFDLLTANHVSSPNTTPVENTPNAPICPYGIIQYHWDTHQCGTTQEVKTYLDAQDAAQALHTQQFNFQKWGIVGGLIVLAYMTKSWILVIPAVAEAVLDVQGGW